MIMFPHKNVKVLAFLNLFTDLKFYSAVFIIYFAQITGSYTLATTILSITMLSGALFEVPTGVISDKIGRKWTTVAGAACAVAYVTCYAIGLNFWLLALGGVFEGLSRAWYSGNNDALLYDSLHEVGKQDMYSEISGKLSSMFQVALMIGALIGGFIAYKSFPLVMWMSVVPQVLCLILSLQLIEPRYHQRGETGNIYAHMKTAILHMIRNKRLRLLSLEDSLGYAIGESTFQFRAAFIKTLWPIWAIGFVGVISNFGATISFWFSGKIIKKFGAFKLQLLTSIYNRVINSIGYGFPTVVSPLLLPTTSFLYGVSSVATNTLMQNEFTNEQRATIASLNSLLGNILFAIFAPILGWMADTFGAGHALLISQVLLLPTIGINWYLFHTSKNENASI
jgi:MFS family permease